MKFKSALLASLVFAFFASVASAAELAGKWKAEFDSQIGVQKYVFDFTGAAEKISGKASAERMGEKAEVALKDIKVTKDDVVFVEMLKFQDQKIRVEYKGKFVNDDELKLTRTVGDFATEEIVAKRVKEK